MEEWRDVVGFEGYYVVSNMGRIMRVARGANGRKPGHIKTPCPNRCGYLGTQLSKDGTNYSVRIHRVVAEAFLGPCPEGMEVNHKNAIKSDNRAENLEWVTHARNLQHAYNETSVVSRKGSDNPTSKLTEADISVIRDLAKQGVSRRQIGRQFGVSGVLITFIINGRNWKHVPLDSE